MKNKKIILIIIMFVVLILSVVAMIVIGNMSNTNQTGNETASGGGVLRLKVNPEIAITYDENALVTKLEAINDAGKKILENYKDYIGKDCRTVVNELVTAIGNAGYFIEEVEGESRQVVIEIEEGSKLPKETFMDEVVSDVKNTISTNKWRKPVVIEGESRYGISDYVDTDYGPENDGDSNYDDTDYGTGNDGVTDYNNSNKVTTENKTTTKSKTTTNKNKTTTKSKTKKTTTNKNKSTTKSKSSNSSDYGNSNYNNSNYGNSNYGNSGYDD